MSTAHPGWLVGASVAVAVVALARLVSGRRLRAARRLHSLAPAIDSARSGGAAVRLAAVVRRRRLACAALLVALAAIEPVMAVVAVPAWLGWRRWRSRRARLADIDTLRRELPEIVDLLLVAVASGLNLSLAVAAAGGRGPPRLAAAFRRATAEVGAGARVADAIESALAPLGEPVRPLAVALMGAARYGTELGSALDRLAFETRQARRRHAEETVRRVPVKLLFPLVLLILPAFALLTVAPLLAEAFRSLRL